ncbi:hypothetical protein HPB49_013007 [Dermacentor silvarum]|uniref:Uncharacterized protein n=1 Tax=Dermacentor silvarum TaxID=543639 RepID=A0ACB8C9K7_DERSI|nr:hypothetical protein HPB49_013007 [Dermacentor silvarum]
MEPGSPTHKGMSHAVSDSPPSRQHSLEDKSMRSIQKAPKLAPQAPEENSSPASGCPPALQASSPPRKQVQPIKKKTWTEAPTPNPKSLSPTASITQKTGPSSPEPKPAEARENVPKIKPSSPRSKKRRFTVNPNETRGTSPPLTKRVQTTEKKSEIGTVAGINELAPVAATSVPSTPLSKGIQATEESPEVEPQIPKDDKQSSFAVGSPRSLPVSPASPTSPAYTLPSCGQVPAKAIVVSAGAVASLLFAFTLVWLAFAKHSFQRSKNTTDASFCCPNEAAQLYAVIDDGVSPCRDFFAYVCMRAIQERVIASGFSLDALGRISANILKGTGNFTSPAAKALHGYYTSCLSEVWQKDLRQQHVTSFVVGMANATSGKMTPADLLRFGLNVQFRYQIDFFFNVAFSETSVGFRWTFMRAATFLYCSGYDCFEVALSGVNAHLKTNYTRQDIGDWQQLLPRESDAGEPGKITTKELLEAFGGLDVFLFEAIMKEFYSEFTVNHPAYTNAKRALLAEIRTLWNASAQPMSLCYVLTSVVVVAMKVIQGPTLVDFPTAEIWHVCNSHADRFTQLWRRTYVDILTSPAKDTRMRSIFVETREALLHYDPLRQLMEAGNDTSKFEAFVRNASLLLPNDLMLSDVHVPTLPRHGFVDNYFRALSFDFDVKRDVWHRGALLQRETVDLDLWNRMGLVREDLYVSPIAYDFLNTVNASRALLADAPVVAARMAAQLWKRVVEHQGWSSRTLAAIQYHRQCMLKSFRTPAYIANELLENTVALQIAASLASGATTISAEGSFFGADPDWFEMKPVWSMFMDSKARFFYARYAYFRCSEEEDARDYINEPLMRSADFAAAFKCPPFQDTANSHACWNYIRARRTPEYCRRASNDYNWPGTKRTWNQAALLIRALLGRFLDLRRLWRLQPYTLPARRQVPVRVIVVSAGALVSISVAFALIWLASAKHSFLRSKNTTDESFCCPNEAAQLYAAIDDAVSPCRDFFAYVCRRAIQEGAIVSGFALDALDRISSNILKGTGNFTSEAAKALHGYYTSCLSEVWQKDLRQQHVTSFVVGMANATSGKMTPADLLRFGLNVQFRYQIDFFFDVGFSDASVEFEWNFMRAITFLYYCNDDCFQVALSGVNAHLKTNYTRQDIGDWQQLLPRQSDAGEPGKITTKELLEAFGGLDVSLFEAIMKEFYPDFSLKHFAYTNAKRALLAEIRILWNASAQPMSLCYVLTSVVVSAMKDVQGRTVVDFPTADIWQVCDTHANRFTQLWRRTYMDILTSPAKDTRMRSIFVKTREALLHYDPLRQLMEAGNDTSKFEAFVRNASLLLPNDLLLSDVHVPTLPRHGFVDNYFRALSFDFDVKREVWHRGALLQRETVEYDLWNRMGLVREKLYVSPIAYKFLSTVNASRALLADAPVIATRMAAQLWKRVVEHQGWSSRTLAAIQYHRQCMLKLFRAPADVANELLESTVALQIAAGLSSGAMAISTEGSFFGADPDWFEMKLVWSTFMDSKARFFYARYAYFWCSDDEYARNYINEPLRHIADFAAAFQCPPFQDTAKSSACWNYMR